MKILLSVSVALALLIPLAFGVFSVGGFGRRSFESPGPSIAEDDTATVPVDVPSEEEGPESVSPDVETAASVGVSGEPAPASPSASPAPEDETDAPDIVDRLVSFGYEDRSSRDIDTIVIHSSYDALGDESYSVSGIIEEYRQYGVAAHYLIDREGTVYRLVEDRDVAYHAGVSAMPDGRTGVNAFSLGIELVEKDTDSPTEAQYASLNGLISHLRGKHAIRYVLGHSDIAPDRKTDPWNFDWDRVVEKSVKSESRKSRQEALE